MSHPETHLNSRLVRISHQIYKKPHHQLQPTNTENKLTKSVDDVTNTENNQGIPLMMQGLDMQL